MKRFRELTEKAPQMKSSMGADLDKMFKKLETSLRAGVKDTGKMAAKVESLAMEVKLRTGRVKISKSDVSKVDKLNMAIDKALSDLLKLKVDIETKSR